MNRICIIAGMPRSSTTFLYHTLPAHPEFFVPARKETEYFSLNYERGKEWYQKFFASMTAEEFGFDISPMYFFCAETPRRIVNFFETPKIILIIRNPVDFSISFYNNRVASGMKYLTFQDFLSRFEYRKDNSSMPISLRTGSLISAIRMYRDQFSDNLLMIHFDAVEENTASVLTSIESFLGVCRYFSEGNFENLRINASNQKQIRVVNQLMHQKWFADLVTRLFPKKLILAVRHRLQRPSNRTGSPLTESEELQFRDRAREHFQPDIEAVDSIFEKGPFVLGSGKPFVTEPIDRASPRADRGQSS